jgi:signal transduction histidine kinase
MNRRQTSLVQRYAPALRRYLIERSETALSRAYELGRLAVARSLGVLEIAAIHHYALHKVILRSLKPDRRDSALRLSEAFFLESLSPFEITHRGFREANLKLQQLIQVLEQRNVDLRRINRELQREIRERRRTEHALRESETHFRQLLHQAEIMQENLRHLSNQVLHAQEEERKRISRELHDEVGQAMTAIHVNLAVLSRPGKATSEIFGKKIADTQRLLQQTMESVHRFALELRPAMLDELGLLPALRSYALRFAERTGLRVRLRATPAAESLNGEQKTVVYRVVQESLTNVAKHAQARRVSVLIRKFKSGIRMQIQDDGRSFRSVRQDSPDGKKHLGLLGMQERVRLANGNFYVEPKLGKGTTVHVEIPFLGLAPPPSSRGRKTTHRNQSGPHRRVDVVPGSAYRVLRAG